MNGFVTIAGAVCFAIAFIIIMMWVLYLVDKKFQKGLSKMCHIEGRTMASILDLSKRIEILEARVQEHILDGRR